MKEIRRVEEESMALQLSDVAAGDAFDLLGSADAGSELKCVASAYCQHVEPAVYLRISALDALRAIRHMLDKSNYTVIDRVTAVAALSTAIQSVEQNGSAIDTLAVCTRCGGVSAIQPTASFKLLPDAAVVPDDTVV